MLERPAIDFKQKISLAHRLIFLDADPHYLAFHARRYLDDIRLDIGVGSERRVEVSQDVVNDQDHNYQQAEQEPGTRRQQQPLSKRKGKSRTASRIIPSR